MASESQPLRVVSDSCPFRVPVGTFSKPSRFCKKSKRDMHRFLSMKKPLVGAKVTNFGKSRQDQNGGRGRGGLLTLSASEGLAGRLQWHRVSARHSAIP